MSDFRTRARELARSYVSDGHASGWFEVMYSEANDDPQLIPWLREVVGLLDNRGSALQAMEAMMKRALVEDQKAGRYKPGVIPG